MHPIILRSIRPYTTLRFQKNNRFSKPRETTRIDATAFPPLRAATDVDTTTTSTTELTDKQIAQVVAVVPKLGQYDASLWRRCHRAICDQGFSTFSFQRIISGQPSLLTWQPTALQAAIEAWRGASQFGDRRVYELLEEYPELFRFSDERVLGQRLTLLKSYAATDKNIWRLLMNAPNLLTDREELIASRIEYVTGQMRAELADVVKSTVMAHSMDSIRTRHAFLDRLGVYKRRSPKVDPKLDASAKNPRLHTIYDCDERVFASKVCGVSPDEWEVFEKLYAVELEKGGGVVVEGLDGGVRLGAEEGEEEEEEAVQR